jgi:hypothetical protein
MPSANGATLTDLYSASAGLDVRDDQPNTPGPGGAAPATTFDLQVEAVAGNVLGGSGAAYVLTVTCIDETLGVPNATMSSSYREEFGPAAGWKPGGTIGNYSMKKAITVAVPAGVRGHLFHCIATLVTVDNNVIEFATGNRFVLV